MVYCDKKEKRYVVVRKRKSIGGRKDNIENWKVLSSLHMEMIYGVRVAQRATSYRQIRFNVYRIIRSLILITLSDTEKTSSPLTL